MALIVLEPKENSTLAEQTLPITELMSSHEVVVPARSAPIQSGMPVIELMSFSKITLKPEPLNELKIPPKRFDRFYTQPLVDASAELLAQKAYLATGNLQKIEARQLVDKYGCEAVGQALSRTEFMREKGGWKIQQVL